MGTLRPGIFLRSLVSGSLVYFTVRAGKLVGLSRRISRNIHYMVSENR